MEKLNKINESSEHLHKGASALMASVAAAAALSFLPTHAEAGGTTVPQPESIDTILKIESNLSFALGGRKVVLRDVGSGAQPNFILEVDGKRLAERGENTDTMAKILEEERVMWEITNAEKPPRSATHENVNGTDIYVSGYAKDLMDRMGITYMDGVLSDPQIKIPLANKTTETVRKNLEASVRGLSLEDALVACTRDEKGTDVYLIKIEGSGMASHLVLKPGDIYQKAQYCK